MSLPTFAPHPTPATPTATLTRAQAAGRLGLHPGGVDKLVRAGIFELPITGALVNELAARQRLRVTVGELTVLRTDARADAYPGEDRQFIGFHVDHTDDELEQTSLRWWRSDPARILDNVLLAVTVATIPVAVYRITGRVGEKYRDGEEAPRHHYAGQLIARVHPGMRRTYPQRTPAHLRDLAKQIMNSRVAVASGGPIGYLYGSEG
ncbi:hypothetical protein [Micromonospora sp. 4G55]|uniref:hypothetical protein n=1 Tax=Micromonospora sp. 4G55 TaxID=2806102 RepID=UPI001A41D8DF|nr:hypothetical protein [Micromonospora sp. 4G55]MBM0255565.1 hypothetical protein [Micromonospora sp. 4G55]